MKMLWAFFLCLVPLVSSGQQVVSVYDDRSMTNRVTLPFYFKTQNEEQLLNVRIQNVSGSPSCITQRDFFKPSHFLVRCENPGTVQLAVDYKGSAGLASISYGPIVVSELKTGYVEPSPTPQPSPTPDPRGLTGRTLIQSSCKACHTTALVALGKSADLRNESFSSLKTAVVSGVRTMQPISPRPSDTELQAIEIYLKNIDGFGGWP